MNEIQPYVVAILVTFNPNIERLNILLRKLSFQVNLIYIVDNNSKCGVDRFYCDDKIFIEVLDMNYGIAYAQNVGVKKAIENNINSYTVFFDQDSNINEGYIEKIYKNYLKLGEDVGLIGPALYNDRDKYFYPVQILSSLGKVDKINITNNNEILTNFIISSGSFLKTEIFMKVGLMKSYFFIDDVDTEFAFRVSRNGYKNYIIPSVTMNHNIGDNSIRIMKRDISIHNPIRRYYMLRNIFILYKLNYFPNIYILHRFFHFIFTTGLILFLCDRRYDYIKSFFRALWDGMFFKVDGKD